MSGAAKIALGLFMLNNRVNIKMAILETVGIFQTTVVVSSLCGFILFSHGVHVYVSGYCFDGITTYNFQTLRQFLVHLADIVALNTSCTKLKVL